MRVAITGGSGFVGAHLGSRLLSGGHQVVSIARGERDQDRDGRTVVHAAVDDTEALAQAFIGCEAVVHCAGINREIGGQTYQRVHVEGTRAVVEAARRAGAQKIVMLSFLRARPDCGSPYHESKWVAEELVRGSGIDFTILKAGMIYGRGDHMLDHLSHALHTFPIFLTVGFREQPIRPLAIEDLLEILEAVTVDRRESRATLAVTGPEQILLSEAVRRVGQVIGRKPLVLPAPVWFHYLLAWFWELTMRVPLTALAQIRILEEGVVDAAPWASPLPEDLLARRRFTDRQIVEGLPSPGPFTSADLRCCFRSASA